MRSWEKKITHLPLIRQFQKRLRCGATPRSIVRRLDREVEEYIKRVNEAREAVEE